MKEKKTHQHTYKKELKHRTKVILHGWCLHSCSMIYWLQLISASQRFKCKMAYIWFSPSPPRRNVCHNVIYVMECMDMKLSDGNLGHCTYLNRMKQNSKFALFWLAGKNSVCFVLHRCVVEVEYIQRPGLLNHAKNNNGNNRIQTNLRVNIGSSVLIY